MLLLEDLARVALEEERDGEAVELLVAGLGDFGLDGLELRVLAKPLGNALPHDFAIARQGSAENLHGREWSH